MDLIYIVEKSTSENKPNFTIPGHDNDINNLGEFEGILPILPMLPFFSPIGLLINAAIAGPNLYRFITTARDKSKIDKVSLNNELEFVFNDLLLYKGDTTKVAYLNLKGKVT